MLALRPYPAPLAGLFGDPEVEAALSPAAQVAAMLRVEAALAAAQAELGLIPVPAAEAIAALDPAAVDLPALEAATARDGVAVPGLVAALREALPEGHAPFLHWGATSQDIADTATLLCLRAVLDILAARLSGLMDTLAALAEAHRGSVMAARTRGQPATPTTFGLKAAGWLMPLVRAAQRLPNLRAEALVLSLGGASGTQAALGAEARQIERTMAARLDLAVAPMPWHAQRDGVVALGAWMARVAGSLGKIGTDLLLLAQAEVGEVALGGAGGSSTMPNKRNPTAAETLVVLSRRALDAMAALQAAPLHAHERDGVAWQGEWLALPELAQSAGACLLRAEDALQRLEVRPERMRANVDAANGLLAAEAASFLLARRMPRPEAQALVKRACAEVLETGRHLADVLAAAVPDLDPSPLRDPAKLVGESDAMIDRVLAARADLAEAQPLAS